MKNVFKKSARILRADSKNNFVELDFGSYWTALTFPKRSLLNKTLKLKVGDELEVTFKVVKRK